MRARLLQGGVVALAIGASACQSTEDISANDKTKEDPGCNCILVNRDNPVLREDVALTDFPYAEAAKRLADSNWAYKAFDTTLKVTGATAFDWALLGHDSFSPSEATGQDVLHSWPTSNGSWTPTSDPANMPWEVHGARFGYGISTVTARKLRADSFAILASNVTRFTLDPKVIVVPIQAVLVLPDYGAADLESLMKAAFGSTQQDLLWDDRWRAKRQRFSSGGKLTEVQGQWTHRTYDTYGGDDVLRRQTDTFILPDDVFGQCNIQFRLVSYSELRVDKELFELRRLDGRTWKPICDKEYGIRYRLKQIEAKANSLPNVRGNLPRVIFNYTVQPTACNEIEPQVDVACDPGEEASCSSAGYAIVGLENVGAVPVGRSLVLAHELGHVLSIEHQSDGGCKTEKSLMCRNVGWLAPHISSGCDEARQWATKYRDRYLNQEEP